METLDLTISRTGEVVAFGPFVEESAEESRVFRLGFAASSFALKINIYFTI
jgi:hypothetical protein